MFKGFATSSFDKDIDYEIDLISLKKTPRKSLLLDSFTLDDVVTFKHPTVETKIIWDSIKDIEGDIVATNKGSNTVNAAKKINDSETRAYLDFVLRYFHELQTFQTFIQKSYTNKIREFGQLTSIELLNSLYIFKNYYQNNKINSIDVNSHAVYNYMFERLLSYLTHDPSFPTLLTNELIPAVQNRLVLVELYKNGIGNYLNELHSLDREFSFLKLNSLPQLSSEIKKTLDQFNQFVNTYSVMDSNFFRILIQINRYKGLSNILATCPELTISHLTTILKDKHAAEINSRIRQASGETAKVKVLIDSVIPYLDLLVATKEVDPTDSFVDLAPLLFEKTKSKDPLVSLAATKVLGIFLSLFNSGFISLEEAGKYLVAANGEIIDGKPYSLEDPVHNYELAQIWESNFPFSLLKLIKVTSFKDLSKDEILEFAKIDLDEPEYLEIEAAINQLVKRIPWTDFLILETILYDDQFRTWMYTREAPRSSTIKSTEVDPELESVPVEASNAEIANLGLDQFVDELTILRDDILEGDFQLFTSNDILCSLEYNINEVYADGQSSFSSRMNKKNVFQFIKLQKRLEKLFEYNAGHTEHLDNLLSTFEKENVPEPKLYVQLPEELELHKFSDELTIFSEDELKRPYKECSADEINLLLDSRIDEVYHGLSNSNPDSRLCKDNVYEFMRLSKRLTRLFTLNGGHTAVLDTLIHSQRVFDDIEKKIASKKLDNVETAESESKPYVQIPDDLQLHKFSNELEILRTDELKKPFKEATVQEVKSLLDWRTNEFLNDLPNSNPSSRMNNKNVYDFVRLSRRLNYLFDMNGGYTEPLDSLIHSQQVFEDFENKVLPQKKKQVDEVYKQIPEDFFLEEYIVELLQLKEEMGIQKFASVPAFEILQKLNNLANGSASITKKIIWSKLFRNLSVLFKHNHDNSFVLDNVLLNGEEFVKYESRKEFEKMVHKHDSSLIGKNSTLVNDSFKYLEDFLVKLNLINKSGIWNLTRSEFDGILRGYTSTLDKSSYEYPVMLDFIESLKEFNISIDYYPNFLQQLYEIKSNNVNKKLSSLDVEDIYKAFIETIEYEENREPQLQQRIICTSENANIGMNDIKTAETENVVEPAKSDYNDSERVLSLLVKNEDPVDLESSQQLRGRIVHEDEDDAVIRKAVSAALHDSETVKEYSQDSQIESETDVKLQKKRTSKTATVETPAIDKSTLEEFLQRVKKEKELDQEREFRESKAFEWSNSMYNSHRSIESNNFFNPLDANTHHGRDQVEYLLWSLDGQTIPFHKKSIGKLPEEDVFGILDKFDKQELTKFVKHFKKLQKKGWKLVGSKFDEDKKYFILARNRHNKKQSFRKFVKSFFATAGAVLLSLVGINWWLDSAEIPDLQKQQKLINHQKPVEAVPPQLVTVAPVADEVVPEEKKSSSFWKSLLWK